MRGKKKAGTKTKKRNIKAKKIGMTKKAATRRAGASGRSSSLAIPGELRANLMEKFGATWKDGAIKALGNI